jgi:hypothetical protein
MPNDVVRYPRYRFSPTIISHAVWLDYRFTLSLRDAENLLAHRGITVSYESIRQWCETFGFAYAQWLRQRAGPVGIGPPPHDELAMPAQQRIRRRHRPDLTLGRTAPENARAACRRRSSSDRRSRRAPSCRRRRLHEPKSDSTLSPPARPQPVRSRPERVSPPRICKTIGRADQGNSERRQVRCDSSL